MLGLDICTNVSGAPSSPEARTSGAHGKQEGTIMWTALGFGIIFFWMLELQRQLHETRDHVRSLHIDVREEIYKRYGERFDGKK
jgi:hypothetical protein